MRSPFFSVFRPRIVWFRFKHLACALPRWSAKRCTAELASRHHGVSAPLLAVVAALGTACAGAESVSVVQAGATQGPSRANNFVFGPHDPFPPPGPIQTTADTYFPMVSDGRQITSSLTDSGDGYLARVFFNDTTSPIYLSRFTPFSNLLTDADQCLFTGNFNLVGGASNFIIGQVDGSFDGETACVFGKYPVDFGAYGYGLRFDGRPPNERVRRSLSFGGAPGVPNEPQAYGGTRLTFRSAGLRAIKRYRFPQFDTSWVARPDETLVIPAGCVSRDCGPWPAKVNGNTVPGSPFFVPPFRPASIPPGRTAAPQFNTNTWYVAPKNLVVRGIVAFWNGSHQGHATGCVHVVVQGGAPVQRPLCVATKDGFLTVGSQRYDMRNNAFIPLPAIPIQQGQLVGMELKLVRTEGELPVEFPDIGFYLFVEELPAGQSAVPGMRDGCPSSVRGELVVDKNYCSPDAAYQLVCQSDGNLVLYNVAREVVWAAGVVGPSARCSMQPDGNLVVYSGNTPIFASGSRGGADSELQVRNDGNVVIVSGARVIWERSR